MRLLGVAPVAVQLLSVIMVPLVLLELMVTMLHVVALIRGA